MKYEFTRKEIYQWLKEQNWYCGQLEQLLLQKIVKDKPVKKVNTLINLQKQK
jgi:hypothetical protein